MSPHASFAEMNCSIARTLDRVGEWWSILILRDAARGLTRFEQFQSSLGISTNSLSRRLVALVEAGMLEKQRYCERPPRDEYVLTTRGEDFRSVLAALGSFGTRHFPPEQNVARLIDTETGTEARTAVIDRVTGLDVTDPRYAFVTNS